MFDLVALSFSLIAGILLGYLLRGKKIMHLSKVAFGAIIVLIFSLGFSIGSNDELLRSMLRVGLNTFVILIFAVLFSVVFVKVTVKLVKTR